MLEQFSRQRREQVRRERQERERIKNQEPERHQRQEAEKATRHAVQMEQQRELLRRAAQDPELKKVRVIMRQERRDQQILQQNQDLVEFIDLHSLPSNVEDREVDPKEIRRDDVILRFVPALQQSRSTKSQTNFCAYYALYNAVCLLSHQIDEIQERYQFMRNVFIPTLIKVKDLRKAQPYDNLTSAELREVTREIADLAIIERSSLSLYGMGVFNTLTDAFDNDQKSAKLVEDFINRKTNQIAVIELLASPEAKEGGHWITIMAERINGQLYVNTTDSLHPIDWYLSDKVDGRDSCNTGLLRINGTMGSVSQRVWTIGR